MLYADDDYLLQLSFDISLSSLRRLDFLATLRRAATASPRAITHFD